MPKVRTALNRKPLSGGPNFGRGICAAAVGLALCAWWSSTTPVAAAVVSAEQFASLASTCAPGVSVDVLRAVASKESHFDPLALHNNTKKFTRLAKDSQAAAALAQSWITAGDSEDVGLMQINAPNLPRLGLTVAQAES